MYTLNKIESVLPICKLIHGFKEYDFFLTKFFYQVIIN